MDHILFRCEEINAPKRTPKNCKWGHGWQAREDLITKYKKEFFVFIESIDFDNLKV
jgi:hypothetical protein